VVANDTQQNDVLIIHPHPKLVQPRRIDRIRGIQSVAKNKKGLKT
jgi:hypothetical protein